MAVRWFWYRRINSLLHLFPIVFFWLIGCLAVREGLGKVMSGQSNRPRCFSASPDFPSGGYFSKLLVFFGCDESVWPSRTRSIRVLWLWRWRARPATFSWHTLSLQRMRYAARSATAPDVVWLAGWAGHSRPTASIRKRKQKGRKAEDVGLWVAGVARGKNGEVLYVDKGIFEENGDRELQRDFGFDLCQMCHHSGIEIKGQQQ